MEAKPNKRPTIWLVGDCEHPDFADAMAWLRANCECRDPQAARVDSPSAIIVVQFRPGSIPARFVESLHRQAPLARLILLTGPWCDGELRTGRLPPGVVRIRWHQWWQQLPGELSRGAARLPRTSTDADRLERQIQGLAACAKSSGRIAIHTASRENYVALADACGALGWQAEWTHADAGMFVCELALLDGWAELLASDGMLSGKARPRVLLVDFPRPDEFSRAKELGVQAIVAKPFTLPTLAAAFAAAAPHIVRSAAQTSVA